MGIKEDSEGNTKEYINGPRIPSWGSSCKNYISNIAPELDFKTIHTLLNI